MAQGINPALRDIDSVAFRVIAGPSVDTLAMRMAGVTALRRGGVVVQAAPVSSVGASLAATVTVQTLTDRYGNKLGQVYLVFLRADQLARLNGSMMWVTVWLGSLKLGIVEPNRPATPAIASALDSVISSFAREYAIAHRFRIRKPPL